MLITFSAGDFVYKAQDKPDGAFLIHTGVVEVLSKTGFLLGTLNTGEIFGEIGETDESLIDQIQGYMFEFEDFLKTSSRDMQTLGQAIDQEELKVAFRGSSDAVINHFLDNLSERVAELIRDDMEIAQPKPVSEVMEARNNIIAQARKLQDAGEIIMSAGDSADYL